MFNILFTLILIVIIILLIIGIWYYQSEYYHRHTINKIDSLINKNIKPINLYTIGSKTNSRGLSVKHEYPKTFSKKQTQETIYIFPIGTSTITYMETIRKEKREYREKLYEYYKLTQDE